jgi:hypothetical protein
MTSAVYQVAGATLTIPVDGGSGNIGAVSTVNPITGYVGLNTARIINTSTGNLATVSFTPSDTTYEFDNLAGTASGAGANAKFNVTVANSGYQVNIANVGSGYSNSETIVIKGNALGGTTTANDLTLTLTVGAGGKIASVSKAGTALWPQSYSGEVTLLPLSEQFIEITGNYTVGGYFASSGNDGNLLITPVQVVK